MVMYPTADEILELLRQEGTEEKRRVLSSFFKTGKGEYGEGDVFLGVVVPKTRAIAREYNRIMRAAGVWPYSKERHEREEGYRELCRQDEQTVLQLLASPYHEARLCALLVWVDRLRLKRTPLCEREYIAGLFLQHRRYINNWDLVDLSTPHLLGNFWLAAGYTDEEVMERIRPLQDSGLLWEKRIAILSTFSFTRAGRFAPLLWLARQNLCDRRDLMQKATGWMLREAGKRKVEVLLDFLQEHHAEMPRTMYRYAIERLSPAERASIG